jgi:hypothetical protein
MCEGGQWMSFETFLSCVCVIHIYLASESVVTIYYTECLISLEPYAVLEFGHSCYKICLVYSKFSLTYKQKQFAIKDTQHSDGPTDKNWECKFRGLWWSFHWCPPSNPVLSELFIWPCFDGIVVPNSWDSIMQRWVHFLSCEYKWGVRIGCNIKLLIHKLSVIHFTWGEIQFPFFCSSKRSMLGAKIGKEIVLKLCIPLKRCYWVPITWYSRTWL